MNRRLLTGAMAAGLLIVSMGAAVQAQTPPAGSPVAAATGQPAKMMLLPKFLGILPFDQAHQGAQEAAAELGNPTQLDFVGPTAENSVAGQIEFMTNARSEEHTSELQSRQYLVCRLLLEKKNSIIKPFN